MKLQSIVVYTIALLAMVAARNTDAQPAWTDVLNLVNRWSISSFRYRQIGPNPQPPPSRRIDLDMIGHRLSLPVSSLTGMGNQGGTTPCGAVHTPASFIESGIGTGIKGVGFLGSFVSPPGGAPLTYHPNQNLFEVVFFHEDYCYGGMNGVPNGRPSREYGFFLAGYDSSIWAYWGTHESQPSQVQAQFRIPGVYPNNQYYFEIYPTGDVGSCGFQVTILRASFIQVFSSWAEVNSYNYGGTITTSDSGFCGAVTSPSGETGYVSAGILAQAQVSGTLPPPSQMNLSLQRVFVGK